VEQEKVFGIVQITLGHLEIKVGVFMGALMSLRSSIYTKFLALVKIIVIAGFCFFLGVPTVAAQSWLLSPPPISGGTVERDTIQPADVLARVQLFHQQLESIRLEMGKPQDPRHMQLATNAHPHEVYFQALTLYIKADRLALELTGSTGLKPILVSAEEISPYHVWLLVNAAYRRLLVIKTELNIPESFLERASPDTTTPTEVGRAIVQANRQLNVMLRQQFSPSEVFQQLEAARQYAQALLEGFGRNQDSTSLPPFQRGKTPTDVFLQLIRCFEQLEELAKVSGVSILHLDGAAARKVVPEFQVQPSDVYDLATLLLSDLAYIHGKKYRGQTMPTVPFPGTKFPSHVFQLARGLQQQLDDLGRLVQKNPDWLSH